MGPSRQTNAEPDRTPQGRYRLNLPALSCPPAGRIRLDVFSSAARGSDFDAARSDVDLLVTYLPGYAPDIATYQDLRDALADLLERPVDLVMEGAVENPFIRAGIERSRQPIYAA